MNDVKVMDTLNQIEEDEKYFKNLHYTPVLFFAEAVALSRGEPGVSIEEIGKCFRHQFDESELECLVAELNKGKL